MSDFYDALETRSAATREAAWAEALPALVAAAQRTPAMSEALAAVNGKAINTRAALAALPVTRKP